MSNAADQIRRDFRDLTKDEQVDLLLELWGGLETDTSAFEMTAAERAELDRRWAQFEAHPDSSLTYQEAKARLARSK